MVESVHNNLADRKNLLEFSRCVTARVLAALVQNRTKKSPQHLFPLVKAGKFAPAVAVFPAEVALDRLGEVDFLDQPSISAAASPPASVELPHGTEDLCRKIDSAGAAGIDSHIPFADTVVKHSKKVQKDLAMLSYLGMQDR